MANTYTRLVAHIVFSTKDRIHCIPERIQKDAYAYMGGILKNLGGKAIIINGMPDHIHVLTHFPARRALSDLVRDLKSNSSTWLAAKSTVFESWQTGYAAFSVHNERIPGLIEYIANQKEHHRERSFKEELLSILDEAGVEYDERYLWD